MFEVVDLRQHILRKERNGADVLAMAQAPAVRSGGSPRYDSRRAVEALFEQNIVAQVVLDASGNIVLANPAARKMLSIGSAEPRQGRGSPGSHPGDGRRAARAWRGRGGPELAG